MTFEDWLDLFDARRSGKQWQAHCPAHEDDTASLSIAEGKDGCVLLKCHAGCELDAILAAVKKTRSDLFPKTREKRIRSASTAKPRTFPSLKNAISSAALRLKAGVTRRDWYHNADGSELFMTVRFDSENGKTFRPFHRQKPARWLMADPPGKLPLFHLPKLLAPENSDQPIFVVEGEKCTCALEETLGVLATTSAHGAEAERKTDWKPLADRVVVILPDNDKSGRKYAGTVEQILTKLSPAAKVKVVDLPGLPEKGDIVDWLEARNGKPPEEIKAELFAAADAVKQREEVRSSDSSAATLKTEQEQAERDDATIERLASLPPLEYERVRQAEAEKLGIKRVSVLDHLVRAKRLLSNPAADPLQGVAVTLADVEPWPEPVKGAEVLDQITERLRHYAVMSAAAADAIALWTAHTHCFRAFMHTPRLNVSSAEKDSGKTTVRDVCALFVARPLLTENTTTAVLFRLIASQAPTVLADEYDTWLGDNEELRGLLNAGHRRGSMIHRCEGEGFEVRGFPVNAPVMLIGIGALPGTLHDRSIRVRLTRAKKGEVKNRFDSRHVEIETELCRKLARWVADNWGKIEAIDPILPDSMFNRVADNWRPLFAIAEVVGGDWPKRCLDAYTGTQSREFEDVETLRVALLTDIQQIFAGTWPPLDEDEEPTPIERIFSKDLCEKLLSMKERPWPELQKGKPISERWIARNLAAFGIRSKNIRISEEQAKGYEVADFKDAFERYVMPSNAEKGGFQASHRPNTRENDQKTSVPKSNLGTDQKSDSTREWDAGTDKKGGAQQNADIEAAMAKLRKVFPNARSVIPEPEQPL
jgi:hypothetical protein